MKVHPNLTRAKNDFKIQWLSISIELIFHKIGDGKGKNLKVKVQGIPLMILIGQLPEVKRPWYSPIMHTNKVFKLVHHIPKLPFHHHTISNGVGNL